MSSLVGHFDVFNGWSGRLPLPWQFQAGIFWTVDQAADGYLSNANFAGYTGDTCMNMGFADNTIKQQCVVSASAQKAFAPFNDSGRAIFSDRIIVAQRGTGVSSPTNFLVISGSDNCGITFTTTGTASYRVYYMVFSGVTLKRASGILAVPADGSNGVVAGLPFNPSGDPSILFCLFSDNTDDPQTGIFSFGFATGAPGEQSFWEIYYNARGGTADGAAGVSETAGWEASFSSFDAAGFTLSQSFGRGVAQQVAWMLLTDTAGSFHVGTKAWPSGAGAVSDPGFLPEGVVFSDFILNEEDTGGQITVGAAASKTEAALAGVANVNDQRRWTAQATESGKVLLDYLGNAGTESGNVIFDGFNANGFDWEGTASGFAGDVRYAALKLSAVAAGQKCRRRGALPVLGVG